MSEFIYTTALRKIRAIDKRIKIIQGGTSAGKTYAILPILIDKCTKNPNLSVSVVSESFPHLRRGCIKDFIDIMKMTNRYIDKHWNRSTHTYKFGNGSYIEFFSADDGDKLRGARRNILFVNECNNITQDAYTQLSTRTDGDSIFLDYNPSHSFWIDDIKKANDSKTIILTYKDNEALSPNIINDLESKRQLALTSDYWENWCKVYLDGQQGQLEGVIFNYNTIDKLPEEAESIGFGMDFGFTNDATTLIGLYRYNNDIIIKEFIYETGLLTPDLAKKIKTFDIDKAIVADSASPQTIAELKSYGIQIKAVSKTKNSIIEGINIMQEHNFYITKDSYNTIEEFNKYSWDKDKTGQTLNKPIDMYNHAMDAIRYIALTNLRRKPSMAYRFA